MKLIFIIIFILFANSAFANEENNDEVEVINLYESKSLDQMVLENLNNENNVKEVVENTTANEVDEEVITSEVEVEQIEIIKDNYNKDNYREYREIYRDRDIG